MKSKIIKIALSLCLAATMAMPAFADINSSSLLGSGEDVTKIVKSKESVTVKNGETIDILDYITVLVSNSQLANHDTLIFDIEDNGDLAFTQDGSSFTANENKGTATAVIKSENEKVIEKIKLSAAKGSVVFATGYKYENPSYNVAVNDAAAPDSTMKIIPTPTGAVFSKAQIDALAAGGALEAVNGVTPTGAGTSITEGIAAGEYKDFVITLPTAALQAAAEADVSTRTTKITAFPMGSSHATNARTAATKVAFVQYALKSQIASKGTLSIKVGETADLLNNVKQGPSSAPVSDSVSFNVDYYNDAADTFDYATIEGTEITGVHTGKIKVVATLGGGAATSFVVNVTDFSKTAPPAADSALSLAFSVAKTTVGGSFKLTVKNAPANAKITYSSLNDKVVSIDANGAVKGVAAGTTKVVADVDGQKLYCTVTVESGAPSSGGSGKPSKVPNTGVSSLNPLF